VTKADTTESTIQPPVLKAYLKPPTQLHPNRCDMPQSRGRTQTEGQLIGNWSEEAILPGWKHGVAVDR